LLELEPRVHLLVQELGHRNVVRLLREEFRDADIVLGQEFRNSSVQELGHRDIIALLEELRDANVVLQELCHSRVEEDAGGRGEEVR